MKVLDLQCPLGHVFEGWFASEDDFQGQRERGLVQCPMCGDEHIEKRLSAPRLNLGARAPATQAAANLPQSRQPVPADHASGLAGEAGAGLPPALQAAWLALSRKIIANTEDVGERFSEEARRIHYGESDARAIRGVASRDQTRELLEEGIEVMSLPIPQGLDGPVQ